MSASTTIRQSAKQIVRRGIRQKTKKAYRDNAKKGFAYSYRDKAKKPINPKNWNQTEREHFARGEREYKKMRMKKQLKKAAAIGGAATIGGGATLAGATALYAKKHNISKAEAKKRITAMKNKKKGN